MIPAAVRQRKRYPERYRARLVLQTALRNGTLIPGACEMAGADCSGPIQGHHEDYSRPLDVRWLCRRHHLKTDWEKRRAQRSERCALCGDSNWCFAKSGKRVGRRDCRTCKNRRCSEAWYRHHGPQTVAPVCGLGGGR